MPTLSRWKVLMGLAATMALIWGAAGLSPAVARAGTHKCVEREPYVPDYGELRCKVTKYKGSNENYSERAKDAEWWEGDYKHFKYTCDIDPRNRTTAFCWSHDGPIMNDLPLRILVSDPDLCLAICPKCRQWKK